MKVYNTLGRKLEEFIPTDPKEVKLYTCGPTVYDYVQIGNLRTFVFYDTLKRTLTALGYKVNHVMNITDVGHLVSDGDQGEDKLEKGARREGKTALEVAKFYTEAFFTDCEELNIIAPILAPATHYINAQVDMAKILVERNYAYITKQAIYFDTSKLSDYGKLTGQKLDEKEIAARAEVNTDPDKKNPQDFAIWFFTVGRYANHELHWASPWGEGFPGWHIECSAIIHETLGEPIDIHCGGVDLIGTHHTNEIAQSESAFDKELAKYWMHSEYLLVDGQKMSKSLGNYIRLEDIKAKGINPMALRLLYLMSHYRSQTNFTWKSLSDAEKNLKTLSAMADLRFQANFGDGEIEDSYFDSVKKELLELMSDNLGTPEAIANLNEFANLMQEKKTSSTKLIEFLEFIDSIFGLQLLKSKDITDEEKKLIKERTSARQNNDWAKSDEIRDSLASTGIGLNDTELGTVWYRL